MIVKGKSYTIYKPKSYNTANGNMYTFSIADSTFDKETKKYSTSGFINCLCFTDKVLNDKDKVNIIDIEGITIKIWNEKPQYTLKIKISEENAEENGTYVTMDELPF